MVRFRKKDDSTEKIFLKPMPSTSNTQYGDKVHTIQLGVDVTLCNKEKKRNKPKRGIGTRKYDEDSEILCLRAEEFVILGKTCTDLLKGIKIYYFQTPTYYNYFFPL